MANVRGGVQIETRRKYELSIPFQSVTGDQSLNVGTLLGSENNFKALLSAEEQLMPSRRCLKPIILVDIHMRYTLSFPQ